MGGPLQLEGIPFVGCTPDVLDKFGVISQEHLNDLFSQWFVSIQPAQKSGPIKDDGGQAFSSNGTGLRSCDPLNGFDKYLRTKGFGKVGVHPGGGTGVFFQRAGVGGGGDNRDAASGFALDLPDGTGSFHSV